MLFDDFHSEWRWARGLTVELLDACSDADLSFQLNDSCGALWKQFRHIGRVHENYLSALNTQTVVFDTAGSYTGGKSKLNLLSYFEMLQTRHQAVLEGADPNIAIDWFGESASLEIHLTRLLSHETLHHGQLILYWRTLGNDFPKNWNSWGE